MPWRISPLELDRPMTIDLKVGDRARNWHLRLCMALALVISACGGGGGGSNGGAPSPNLDLRAEAVVLSGLTRSRLRQPASSVLAVYGYNESGARIAYTEGLDWQFTDQGIARTATSRIPDFADYRYVASIGASFEFSPAPRNPPLIIPFQVYVDYRTSRPDRLLTPAPVTAQRRRVVCLGDSIAAGAHTIANHYLGTDADSYCGLLRAHLGPGADVEVLNPSVPGGTLAAVQATLPALLGARPQVIILAFGMNDHLGGAAALPDFEAQLARTVRDAKAADSQVILVGFFQQNIRWVLEDQAQTLAYNQAISRVATSAGVPFIDIRSAFGRAAPDGNPIESRTGDFMHHPNNFGHRIYFSMLLPYFLAAPVMASTVPNFIDLGD